MTTHANKFGAKVLAAAALATGLAVSAPAAAAPVLFTVEANFQAAASAIALATESFEGSSVVGSPIPLPGITVTNIGSSSINTTTDVFPTLGTESLLWSSSGFGDITFTFAAPINAFGIDIVDLGTIGATTLSVTTNNGGGPLFTSFSGGDGNVLFGGLVDATPFTTVTFSNTSAGDGIIFDGLQSGALNVPEPASMAILGLGLAGLGFVRRRKTA